MENENWVSKSSWPFTLVLRPTLRRVAKDKFGNETVLVDKCVRVSFENCFLVVNDGLQQSLGIPKETIAEWVEGQPSFGRKFWLVESPTKKANKEDAEALENAQKAPNKTQVIHGPRKSKSGS